MPLVYDKMNIRFLYPDNWTLDEREAADDSASITVYAPGGSFWSIVLDSPAADPAEMSAAALRTLKAEYEDFDAEPVTETLGGCEIAGYDASFICFDLTSTATIRGFRTGSNACLVVCQAEDRDYVTDGPVFRAITASLLHNAAKK
jgi:hypothetical protein